MKTALAITLACSASFAVAIQAAISVGPTGTSQTFDSLPPVSQWSTLSVAGGAGDITSEAALDAAVQLLDASSINMTLGSSSTMPPSQNALARWNSSGLFLQTRPTGNAFLVLMATLQNDTGFEMSSLGISYDFGSPLAPDISESIVGLRSYFSLSGAAGSWQLIPEFSVPDAGTVSANLDLGSWGTGSSLYILWADDNGPGGTTVPTEGVFTIDNFEVVPEPSTTALALIGVGAFLFLGRRRIRSGRN